MVDIVARFACPIRQLASILFAAMAKKTANIVREITEERFAFSGGVVDRSDPLHPCIRGALLCGPKSENTFIGEGKNRVTVKGRRYLSEAFAGDRIKRYNGRQVFLNHPENPGDSRDYRDKIATVKNPRHREDGMPIGDLAVNPKHPQAEQFLWDAEHAPDSCGMSHRAYCKWRVSKDDWAEAVELEEVRSVDVVIDSATTGGIFERKELLNMPTTIAGVTEWVTRHPKSTAEQILKVKQLVALGDYAGCELASEMAEGADAEDGVFAAIRTAAEKDLADVLDSKNDPEKIKLFFTRLRKILALHGALAESVEEPDGKTKVVTEGSSIGFERAIKLCSEGKYTATASEYTLLAKCGTDVEAKAFIAEQASKASSSPPRSTGRTQTTPPKTPVQEQRAIPAWNAASSRN